MTRPEFFTNYVSTFLATHAALNHSLLEVKDLHPVDLAVDLATKAWEALEDYKKS